MTNKTKKLGVVNSVALPSLDPPANTIGAVGWMKRNLFSSPFNSILTLLGAALLLIVIPPILNWTIFDAVWSGGSEACKAAPTVACWPFVGSWWEFFIYGFYDKSERWRIDIVLWFLYAWVAFIVVDDETRARRPTSSILAFVIGAISVIFVALLLRHGAPTLWLLVATFLIIGLILWAWNLPNGRSRIGLLLLFIFPIIAYFILGGGVLGLKEISTSQWGGFSLTLVIAITGIVASLPLGILLALGRRSELPALRMVCTLFIEFWRGVPLITVLFMASFMLPLFMPKGVQFDQLIRALIGVALFSSAYMAEVIRGGLQAIPKGQYEGSQSLGLSYWKTMGLIVMPQALKIVIPGIVSTFIGLFKDTTLVLIIGLIDFLNSVQTAFTNPEWSIKSVPYTGYVIVAVVFWFHCYGMAWYSKNLEDKLHTGHKR